MVAQRGVLWSPALVSWKMKLILGSRTPKCFFFFFFSAVGKEEGYFPSISITVPLSSPVEHDEKKKVDMKPHVVFEADQSICVFTKRPITITAQTPLTPHQTPTLLRPHNSYTACGIDELSSPLPPPKKPSEA